MQTTKKLYCFGPTAPASASFATADAAPDDKWPEPGPAKSLQVVPSELLLQPGDTVSFQVRALDANGLTVKKIDDPSVHPMGVFHSADGQSQSNHESLLQRRRTIGRRDGQDAFRRRLRSQGGWPRRLHPRPRFAGLPILEDFEAVTLTETTTNSIEPPTHSPIRRCPGSARASNSRCAKRTATNALSKLLTTPSSSAPPSSWARRI